MGRRSESTTSSTSTTSRPTTTPAPPPPLSKLQEIQDERITTLIEQCQRYRFYLRHYFLVLKILPFLKTFSVIQSNSGIIIETEQPVRDEQYKTESC